MLLNRIEKALINNSIRDRMLRGSVRALYRMAGAPLLSRVLEVGCGEGAGMAAITHALKPQTLDAFDLDPAQVERARRRITSRGVTANRLWVGDAENIDAPSGSYDAVCEFTILHHVPNWRCAQREIARVLRPGGLFLFEELSHEFFHQTGPLGWALRRYTEHPWESMFDWPSFADGLTEAGLRIIDHQPQPIPGWHRGVAQRI
jgi:ubiquinone/menaquinone biosynthesis C-methylase UbiE